MNRWLAISNNLKLQSINSLVFKYDYYINPKIQIQHKLYDEPYSCIVLSENFIACVELDSINLDIWNINSGQKINSIAVSLPPTNNISHTIDVLRLLPNGNIITGGTDGILRMWDWRTSELKASYEVKSWINDIIILSSNRIAVGYQDGDVMVLDINTLQRQQIIQLDSPINKLIKIDSSIMIKDDYYLTLWNFQDGTIDRFQESLAIYNLPESDKFITADSGFYVWQLQNGIFEYIDSITDDDEINFRGIEILNVFPLLDTEVILFNKISGQLFVDYFDIKKRRILPIIQVPEGNTLRDVKYLPDSRIVLLLSNFLQIWDINSLTPDFEYEDQYMEELTIIKNKIIITKNNGDISILITN